MCNSHKMTLSITKKAYRKKGIENRKYTNMRMSIYTHIETEQRNRYKIDISNLFYFLYNSYKVKY